MNIQEQFINNYNDTAEFYKNKTSSFVTSSEQILQIMQIAATLTTCSFLRDIEGSLDNLPKNLN